MSARNFGIMTAKSELTSGPADGGVQRNRSRRANTHPGNSYPLPSRSISRIETPLESIDLAQSRLKEAILFALPVSILLWILIGLAAWGLISVFL